MPRVHLTDLTLRDAHQSLIATRLLTADMLPVADRFDRAGFWSLETWGGATFDVSAPATGRLAEKRARPRDLLRPGQVLGLVEVEDTA